MTNNLSKEMKNSNIEEPKFEKWNELPPEMKLETIKKLDFKTRCNLRSTCRLEKSLVDSQKFHIDKLQLYSELVVKRIQYKHGSQEKSKKYDSGDEIIPSFEYVMEHGIIGELLIAILDITDEDIPSFQFISKHVAIGKLDIDINRKSFKIIDKLRPLSWNVKCMKLHCYRQKDLNFCLERLNEKVERIQINTELSEQFSFDSILTIPQIISVPFLEVSEVKQPDLENVYKVAQILIKNDATIGQRFHLDLVVYGRYRDFNEFKKEFSTRIVQMEITDGRRLGTRKQSKHAESVRIRTDNPSKHILIQITDLMDADMLHMTVIPANMKETEYDWKWIEGIEDNSGPGHFDFREIFNDINEVNLDDLEHLLLDL